MVFVCGYTPLTHLFRIVGVMAKARGVINKDVGFILLAAGRIATQRAAKNDQFWAN